MARIAGWLSLVLSLAGAAPLSAADKAAFRPLPGGIADADGKYGYVTGASGAVEALDLTTGKLLWESKAASKPLALFDGKVLAQQAVAGKANQVRVAVLAAAGGKLLMESDPVVFPDWVATGLTYGRSFASHGRIDNGDLFLVWQARAWYAGGARPTREIEEKARKNAEGVTRVHLKTGKVEPLTPDKVPAEAGAKLPTELEKVTSRQYWNGSDWRTSAFVVGDTVSALDLQIPPGGKQKMSLKRWDRKTARALDTVTLLEGKSLWPMASLDGVHVLIHQALPKEQLPGGDYAWWVFSLETGKQVAKLPYEAGTMAIFGSRAFQVVTGPRKGPGAWVQPRTLRALDLKTGKLVWERPVEPQRILPPLP
jgi:outer membrane protein assembly factor BamB